VGAEQELQRTIIEHLEWRAVKDCFYFAVPNGGWRSPIEAAIFKGLGTKPGIPDLLLIHGGKTYGLELKSAKGKLTPAPIIGRRPRPRLTVVAFGSG
jgi:hypothetical protein